MLCLYDGPVHGRRVAVCMPGRHWDWVACSDVAAGIPVSVCAACVLVVAAQPKGRLVGAGYPRPGPSGSLRVKLLGSACTANCTDVPQEMECPKLHLPLWHLAGPAGLF